MPDVEITITPRLDLDGCKFGILRVVVLPFFLGWTVFPEQITAFHSPDAAWKPIFPVDLLNFNQLFFGRVTVEVSLSVQADEVSDEVFEILRH